MSKPSTYQRICEVIEQNDQFGVETLERLVETKRLFELTGKALTLSGMILNWDISEWDFAYQFDELIEKWLESGQKIYDEKEGL